MPVMGKPSALAVIRISRALFLYLLGIYFCYIPSSPSVEDLCAFEVRHMSPTGAIAPDDATAQRFMVRYKP